METLVCNNISVTCYLCLYLSLYLYLCLYLSPKALNIIAAQTVNLETTVNVGSSHMSWMLFVLIGCVVVIGFLMYNRMHYYEKKHFI